MTTSMLVQRTEVLLSRYEKYIKADEEKLMSFENSFDELTYEIQEGIKSLQEARQMFEF